MSITSWKVYAEKGQQIYYIIVADEAIYKSQIPPKGLLSCSLHIRLEYEKRYENAKIQTQICC